MGKAKATLVNGMQFVGTADSGHAVVMDVPGIKQRRQHRLKTNGTAPYGFWRMFRDGCNFYLKEEKTECE